MTWTIGPVACSTVCSWSTRHYSTRHSSAATLSSSCPQITSRSGDDRMYTFAVRPSVHCLSSASTSFIHSASQHVSQRASQHVSQRASQHVSHARLSTSSPLHASHAQFVLQCWFRNIRGGSRLPCRATRSTDRLNSLDFGK